MTAGGSATKETIKGNSDHTRVVKLMASGSVLHSALRAAEERAGPCVAINRGGG